MRMLNAFSLSRRAFLGAAAAAGGAGAATGGAALAASAPNPQHAEPDLVDATSNAPSYWAHPRAVAGKAGGASRECAEPLAEALKG